MSGTVSPTSPSSPALSGDTLLASLPASAAPARKIPNPPGQVRISQATVASVLEISRHIGIDVGVAHVSDGDMKLLARLDATRGWRKTHAPTWFNTDNQKVYDLKRELVVASHQRQLAFERAASFEERLTRHPTDQQLKISRIKVDGVPLVPTPVQAQYVRLNREWANAEARLNRARAAVSDFTTQLGKL